MRRVVAGFEIFALLVCFVGTALASPRKLGNVERFFNYKQLGPVELADEAAFEARQILQNIRDLTEHYSQQELYSFSADWRSTLVEASLPRVAKTVVLDPYRSRGAPTMATPELSEKEKAAARVLRDLKWLVYLEKIGPNVKPFLEAKERRDEHGRKFWWWTAGAALVGAADIAFQGGPIGSVLAGLSGAASYLHLRYANTGSHKVKDMRLSLTSDEKTAVQILEATLESFERIDKIAAMNRPIVGTTRIYRSPVEFLTNAFLLSDCAKTLEIR